MRRPAPPRDIPPPLELECLKVLWALGQGSVHDVREALASRELAYTTVMTLLDRLEKRGSVTRHKLGRAFVYKPSISRETVRRVAVKDLVDGFFDGSVDVLQQYLREGAAAVETAAIAGTSAEVSTEVQDTEPLAEAAAAPGDAGDAPPISEPPTA